MIHRLHGWVWGPVLLVSLLGIGISLTWRSGIFQIRRFPYWWKATVGSLSSGEKSGKSVAGDSNRETVSRVQAACTALAATVGTGNIAGVATALTAGGPGAVFWMWISALLGMATAYSETYLGIRYRRRGSERQWFGGPCVYMAKGLKMPGLAMAYGGLCLLASLGMGSMVQSNAIAQTLRFSLNIPLSVSAVLVTLPAVGIIAGGIKRIAVSAQWLMPLSSAVYALFSLAVVWVCRGRLPAVLSEIIRDALLPRAVLGGAGGYGISRAFRYGIARGVFSNEAGLGTLAGLHSAAEDTTPQEQGMWAMFEVFFDTIFICTLTALVILCAVGGEKGLAGNPYDGAAMTGWCFQKIFGAWGGYIVSFAMTIFAFATIIAWFYLGKQTLGTVLYLAAERFPQIEGWSGLIEKIYILFYGYAVFLGCVCSLTAVWELSDIWNGLMAFPNILALFFLRKEIVFDERRGEK